MRKLLMGSILTTLLTFTLTSFFVTNLFAATVTPINTGSGPDAIGVNPVTNKTYVMNASSGYVTAINGNDNSSKVITIGIYSWGAPSGIAVNPITNRIYVSHYYNSAISVIDGNTDTLLTTITAGADHKSIAINVETNKIYVTNYNSNTVTVINGTTLSTTNIPVGSWPLAIAANPVTNKIYVTNQGSYSISVIDGTNDTVIKTVGNSSTVGYGEAIAVNPATNKIYAAGTISGQITVIDGSTDTISANFSLITAPSSNPPAISINPVTNRVYVADGISGGKVYVIDGSNNSLLATVNAGTNPHAIAINPVTNTIYTGNGNSADITAIDGLTNATTTIAGGGYAVGVNATTNSVYAARMGIPLAYAINEASQPAVPLGTTITPFPGDTTTITSPTYNFTTTTGINWPAVRIVYYQIDSTSGVWQKANIIGTNQYQITPTTPPLTPGSHTIYAFATDGQDSTSVNTGTGASPLIGAMAAYTFTIPAPPAPTDGTLTATGGNNKVSLSWTPATSGSGIVSYKLAWDINGGTTIPDCASGKDIGNVTSYTHSGLFNGQTYYYRVCAVDTFASVSTGATAFAATAAQAVAVTKTGTGTGTVKSQVAGINCGTTCSATMDQIVILTAQPDAGSYFAGWSGDCVSSALSCTLTVDTSKTVTASFTTTAPTTVPTWNRTLQTPGNDSGNAIRQTADGGSIIAGSKGTAGLVIKLSRTGAIEWQNGYGFSGNDLFTDIQQTADGGYIVAGYSSGYAWVLKLTADGSILWQNRYGGTGVESANSIQPTADGGYIFTGTINNYGYSNIWVVKLDSGGDIVWQNSYGSTGSNSGASIHQTSSGQYILAGRYDYSTYNFKPILMLLDVDGSVIWKKIFGVSGEFTSVQQTRDGGFIAEGQNGIDAWFVKLDSSGNMIWNSTFYYLGGTQPASAIIEAVDGSFVAASAGMLVRISAAGSGATWNDYAFINGDQIKSVVQDADGGLLATGTSTTAFDSDIWHLKTDASGDISGWTKTSSATYTFGGAITELIVSNINPTPSTGSKTQTFVTPQNYVTLTITKTGSGSGLVTAFEIESLRPSIDCGRLCTATYPVGTLLTLNAIPFSSSTFDGGTGATITNGSLRITSDTTLTVTFANHGDTLLLNETFDATILPANWTVATTSGNPWVLFAGANSPLTLNSTRGGGGYISADSLSVSTLTSPLIDLFGYSAATLVFKANGGSGGTSQVEISSDGGTTWTSALYRDPITPPYDFSTGSTTTIVDISALVGSSTAMIRFSYSGGDSASWDLDDVQVYGVADITAPQIDMDIAQTYNMQWGLYGTGNGEFSSPANVAVDGMGSVYIADNNNHRIQKFDSSGRYLTQWGSNGTVAGQFNTPLGIAVDNVGNVYVSDTNNHRIQKFDNNGLYLSQFGTYGSGQGQFNNPNGIAVDNSGNIYVSDLNNSRIQKFDSNGSYLTEWGSLGSAAGQLKNPRGIALDGAGNLYVADFGNNRIQKFTTSGVFLKTWGSPGTGSGFFNSPYGIATDSKGNVYVSDINNNRVQKFDSTGTFLTKWGFYGSGNGQFRGPRGVAVDKQLNVYIVDLNNNRVQKLVPWAATSSTPDGAYSTGAAIDIAVSFNKPVFSTGLDITLSSGAVISTGPLTDQITWYGTYNVVAADSTPALTISSVSGTITSKSGLSTANPVVPPGLNIADNKAITILAAGQTDITRPVDGAFVTATPQNGGAVLLNWQAATDDTGVTSYRIVYDTAAMPAPYCYGSGGTSITSTGSPDTITGLGLSSYNIRVCAVDAAGNSSVGVTTNVALLSLSYFNVTGSISGNGTISCLTPAPSGMVSNCTINPVPGASILNVTGCGSGTLSGNRYTTAPISADCNVTATIAPPPTLGSTNQISSFIGGNGSISVTGTGSWSAVSNVPWITITSGATGFGNGTVNYTVAPGPELYGTITVAAQPVIVRRAGPQGGLDMSFNPNPGIFSLGAGGQTSFYSVARQPDGKLVAVGTAYTGTNTLDDIIVVRYNSNGTLDSSFGTGGTVIWSSGVNSWTDSGVAVAIQTDGKIVVAGTSDAYISFGAVIFRLNNDGTPDTSFNSAGPRPSTLFFDPTANGYLPNVKAMRIQPDGKILLSGSVWSNTNTNDAFLARFNTDGSLDTTFNDSGHLTFKAASTTQDYFNAMELMGDGKIVVTGYSYNGKADVLVARYDSYGTLDTTFNATGFKVVNTSTDQQYGNGLAVKDDGSIYISGYIYGINTGYNSKAYLLHLLPDGTLNTGFGTSGVSTYFPANTSSTDFARLTINPDGSILVAGSRYSTTGNGEALLLKYSSTGVPDNMFGGNGITSMSLPASSYNDTYGMLVQPDGSVVTVGINGTTPFSSAFVMRQSMSSTPSANININPSTYNFNTVPVGGFATLPVTIANNGAAQLNVSSISIAGAGYYIDVNAGVTPCGTASALAANSSCTLSVKIAPTAPGNLTGTLTVLSDDPISPSISAIFLATAIPPLPLPDSISGSIIYSGGKTGRIYLSTTGTNGSPLGTSIKWPTETTYTIRGLQPGSYTVNAFMDDQNLGIWVQTSPSGNSPANVTSTGLTGVDIILNDTTPTAPPAPANISGSAGDSAIILDWDKPHSGNIESADFYDIYWGTSLPLDKFNAIGSRLNFPAGTDSPAVITGLTNGTSLYFIVIPKSAGVEGTASKPLGPLLVGVPVGGFKVSGTVDYTGQPAGSLVVAVVDQANKGAGKVFFTKIPNPATSQNFTVSGVPNGNYAIYSILDLNNDNIFANGDIMSNDLSSPKLKINGADLAGIAITLNAVNADATIRTNHMKQSGGTIESYTTEANIQGGLKIPVKVALVATTNTMTLPLPIDIALSKEGGRRFNYWGGSNTRPNTGDSYTFDITYDDDTTDTAVSAAVTGINDNFPTSPLVSIPTSTVPTFSWGAPSPAPAGYYSYAVWVNSTNNGFYWDSNDLPDSTTSVVYGANGGFAPQLTVNSTYNWQVGTRDQYGNMASIGSSFTPTLSGTPLIIWSNPLPITYGTALSALQLNATTSVPGIFTYTPDAGALPGTGSQTLAVVFTPTDTSNYTTATASVTLDVVQAPQVINFGIAPVLTYGGATGTLTATGGASGIAVTFSSLTTSVCTVSGATVTPLAAGTCTVAADQAGNLNYLPAAQATQSFTVAQATQTAMVSNSPQNYNGSPQAATVTCLGGGTATNILTGGAASQTSAGSYAVTADCPASTNYAAATAFAAGSFVINQATPTASITNSPAIYNSLVQTATITCLGGGTATLASGGSGTNVGSYPATVDCAASTNYAAAYGLAAGSFVINQATQTITFGAAPSLIYGGATGTLSASDNSTLPITFSSVTPAVCSVSGNTVTPITTGTCTITADQTGDSNYLPAAQATQSFTISKATQTTLAVTGLPVSAFYGQTGILAMTTGGSGTGAIAFSAGTSTACTIDPVSGAVTITSGTGSCDITAVKAADANYTATASASIAVPITKAAQTIGFTPPSALVYGGAAIALTATSSSGLTVTFASTTLSVCTVSGSTLTATGTGTCTVAADQSGNSNYAVAAQIQQSITTNAASFTITASSLGTGGTISSPGTTAVNYGTTPAYTITPDPGYTIVDIRIDGRSTANTNNYTFSSINASHTIDAVFGPDGVIDPANITGKPQLADALLVFTAALGDATLTPAQIKKVDCSPIKSGVPQPDGKIDHSDVVVMLRRVVGLEKW